MAFGYGRLPFKARCNAWSIWVRPAMLLNVYAGRFLLVAFLQNDRMLEADRANNNSSRMSLQRVIMRWQGSPRIPTHGRGIRLQYAIPALRRPC